MNFIVKNLGWFLLLLFFLFMLFIIYTSQPQNIEGTGSTLSGTITDEEANRDLEEIINDIRENSEENDNQDGVEESEDSEQKDIESREEQERGFFERLFGRDREDRRDNRDEEGENNIEEQEENSENEEQGEENTTETSEQNNEGSEQVLDERMSYITTQTTSNTTSSDYIKGSGNNEYKDSYVQTKEQYETGRSYPDAKIGDVWQVNTFALKLNNAYFNTTLGYMHRGDMLEQLENINSYGCFRARVLSGNSVGKTGYVCTKYLKTEYISENTTQGVVTSDQDIKEEVTSKAYPQTNVGDLIVVEAEQAMIGGKTIFRSDILEQLSPIGANGCFEAMVYSSKVRANNMTFGRVCTSKIY